MDADESIVEKRTCIYDLREAQQPKKDRMQKDERAQKFENKNVSKGTKEIIIVGIVLVFQATDMGSIPGTPYGQFSEPCQEGSLVQSQEYALSSLSVALQNKIKQKSWEMI